MPFGVARHSETRLSMSDSARAVAGYEGERAVGVEPGCAAEEDQSGYV
jgi:hypothetical protein